MKKVVPVILFIAISLFAGYVSRLLQAGSLASWYPFLLKAPLTPPAALFPFVWAVLYVLVGIAAGIMWGVSSVYSRLMFSLFFLQLFLNVLWSFCFFYMQSPLVGLVVLLVMDLFALLWVAGSFLVKRLAGWLVVPYVLWLLFATYLNLFIAVYN